MIPVEPAQPEDVEHIHRISKEVFDIYGDYGKILPRFFTSQGVTTYVARIGEDVVGFVMLGFLPWAKGEKEGSPWIADLLAIAVESGHQRHGVGSALMHQALDLVAQMSEWRDVKEIQLTCAESNQVGLNFFARHGFKISNPHHGNYSEGQVALRLTREFVSGSDEA
jgi:ribosomal protein S18 acetylase RimI-like enzyme